MTGRPYQPGGFAARIAPLGALGRHESSPLVRVSRAGGALAVMVGVLLAGCGDQDGAGPVARTSSPPASSAPATSLPATAEAAELDGSTAASIEDSVTDAQRLLESLDQDFTQDP
jgi:hypothetical protein